MEGNKNNIFHTQNFHSVKKYKNILYEKMYSYHIPLDLWKGKY